MRTLRMRLTATALALAAVAACSSDNGDDGGNNQSLLSGTIDGGAWTPNNILSSKNSSSVSITGVDASGREIDITITGATAAGTFASGPGGPSAVSLQIASQAWVGHLTGGSGSVIITSLTGAMMTGTYDVTVTAQTATGATGTKHLVGTFTGYFGQT